MYKRHHRRLRFITCTNIRKYITYTRNIHMGYCFWGGWSWVGPHMGLFTTKSPTHHCCCQYNITPSNNCLVIGSHYITMVMSLWRHTKFKSAFQSVPIMWSTRQVWNFEVTLCPLLYLFLFVPNSSLNLYICMYGMYIYIYVCIYSHTYLIKGKFEFKKWWQN